MLVALGQILLFSVVFMASTADLEYVDYILDLTTSYYPQTVRLSSEPISGLTEPVYNGAPTYGSITLGGKNFALVLDRQDSDGKLYADADGSKVLSSVEWVQRLWDGSYAGSVCFQLPVADDRGVRDYRVFLVWSPAMPTSIVYFRDNYQQGQIELGGVTYRIAIIDENSDGMFNDLEHALLLIDIDQDGELLAGSDSHEAYWLNAPFNIDGTVYMATSVSPDDSKIVIDNSDAWVEPKVPLAVGFPAPDFSVVDADGEELSLSSLAGKIVVLDLGELVCSVP